MEPIIISVKSRSWGARLFSRLVWQELFNIYRQGNGDLSNMDNLLCDLYTIERHFKVKPDRLGDAIGTDFDLYWRFDRELTETSSQADTYVNDACYKISFNRDSQKIIITYMAKVGF